MKKEDRQQKIANISKAIEWCVFKRIPFAAYLYADSKFEINFWAAPSVLTMPKEDWHKPVENGFFISKFNTSFDQCYWLPFELTAEELLKQRFSLPANPYPDEALPMYNTDEKEYLEGIRTLIDSFAGDVERKTVISLVQTQFIYDTTPEHLFYDMIGNTPEYAFCNMFYHPATGFWMGATPELLLRVNKRTKKLQTMALAGTVSLDEEFDNKNLYEHIIVGHYIREALGDLGIKLEVKSPKTVAYGDIKHICTTFEGECGNVPPGRIIDALNPTPALCGNPKEQALKDISAIEKHDRECYGGYIGINTPQKLVAFVNIRCVKFNRSMYRFFGGGGILLKSDPELEYEEALSKIDQLNNLFFENEE